MRPAEPAAEFERLAAEAAASRVHLRAIRSALDACRQLLADADPRANARPPSPPNLADWASSEKAPEEEGALAALDGAASGGPAA